MSFVIGVLPSQLFSYFFVGAAALGTANLFSTSGGIALYLAMLALSLFCSMLVQAMLVRVTVAQARGESASIAAAFGAALPKLLPLLALSIIMLFGLGFAMLLLLVPGVILYLMWCVAGPALVAEDVGVFEALSRSRALTRGNRWKIFGLMMVLLVLLWVFSAVMGILFISVGLTASLAESLSTGVLPLGYLVVSAVASTVMTAVWGTLISSLYVQLRTAQEGPMTDALADVFA